MKEKLPFKEMAKKVRKLGPGSSTNFFGGFTLVHELLQSVGTSHSLNEFKRTNVNALAALSLKFF